MSDTGRAVVAVTVDVHGGSSFAVSPSRWILPPHQQWQPNPLQEVINQHYLECWDRIGCLRRKARLISLYVGDMTEGLHHDSKDNVTNRLDIHEDFSVSVIHGGLERAKFQPKRGDVAKFYEGTDDHDGAGGESLRRVAKRILNVHPDDPTDYVKISDRLNINGVKFWITHKPGSGPGTRSQTHGNAFQNWLRSLYIAGLECGDVPRYVLSAHHHQFLRRDVYALRGEVALTGFICPSWKIKDSYIMQVAPFALTSIGMLAFDITSDGHVTEYDWRIPVEQSPCEEL